ncbi:MAG: polysaccharide biosynthesis/export family protein [Blastocatellia bacterium]
MSTRLDKAIFAGLILAIIFTALAHGAVESWAVAIFELIIVALILMWGAKAIADKKLSVIVPKTALPLAALLVFAFVQSLRFTAHDGRRLSLSMDVEATRAMVLVLLCLIVAFVMAANFFTSHKRVRAITAILIVYGLAMAIFALVQHFTWNGRFYWLRQASAGVTSPFGPFANHNHFAGYMELLVGLPLAMVITRAAKPDARLFYLFAATMMAVAAVASLSRGGMISLAAELVFLALMSIRRDAQPRRAARLLQSSALVALIVSAIAAGIYWTGPERVLNRVARTNLVSEDPKAETFFASRGWIWRDTLAMISANPVTGVGFGAYETAYPLYSKADVMNAAGASYSVDRAHNDYLQTLADCGILGGLIIAWFIVQLFRAVARGAKSRDPLLRAFALGGGAGLFGLLTHSLFDFNLQLPSNALLFLMMAAIVSHIGTAARERKTENAQRPVEKVNEFAFVTGVSQAMTKSRISRLISVSIVAAMALVAGSFFETDAQERRQPKQYQPTAQSSNSDVAMPNIIVSPGEDYRIGPSDVIEIVVEDAPELSRAFRVSSDGFITLPFIGRVPVQQKTTDELSKLLADRLRGDYLQDPQVSVAVLQINSHTFFVQGAVRRPGLYQIEGNPSLLKLLTVAGGLSENYGSTAFIIREIKAAEILNVKAEVSNDPQPQTPVDAKAKYELLKVNINGLLRGNFDQDISVGPGDIVHIPPTDIFFVAGEVNAPGSFPLKEGTTLRQAISLAQGTTFQAAATRAIIFREELSSGKRQEIAVDIPAVMQGKKSDVPILANDIIIIPNSRLKSVGGTLLRAFGVSAARIPGRYGY